MALTSYTALGSAIASVMDVKYADISAVVPDIITVGEARLFRETRTTDMETTLGGLTIASGVIAVPSSYLELKNAYISSTTPYHSLERRSAEWIYKNYPTRTATDIPKFIAREGDNFIFGPYPNGSYVVSGIFYKKPTAIDGTGVNPLFTANPDLYLFACLAESEIYVGRDNRVGLWEAKYKKILQDVNMQDKAEGYSGSSLEMRSG
jgi:hypothetical protein